MEQTSPCFWELGALWQMGKLRPGWGIRGPNRISECNAKARMGEVQPPAGFFTHTPICPQSEDPLSSLCTHKRPSSGSSKY